LRAVAGKSNEVEVGDAGLLRPELPDGFVDEVALIRGDGVGIGARNAQPIPVPEARIAALGAGAPAPEVSTLGAGLYLYRPFSRPLTSRSAGSAGWWIGSL